MMGQRSTKQIALLLALLFLISSGPMMIQGEGHALQHEHHGNHAARHATFVCTWMCAASTFVHSADQRINQTTSLFYEKPAAPVETFLRHLFISSIHIRPPPIA